MEIVLKKHEDLITKWGESIMGTPLEVGIKSGLAKYYHILNNENYFDDFWIYIRDFGLIELCIHENQTGTIALDSDLMNLILKTLKEEDYKKVEITVYSRFSDRIEKLKEYGFKEDPNQTVITLEKDL